MVEYNCLLAKHAGNYFLLVATFLTYSRCKFHFKQCLRRHLDRIGDLKVRSDFEIIVNNWLEATDAVTFTYLQHFILQLLVIKKQRINNQD